MNWYVLQTMTGEEEKLVTMVRRMLPAAVYGDCFVLYYEQLWRRHEGAFVHVARAFPGYVFITAEKPDELFLELKRVPAMSKMMAGDNLYFLAVEPEEAAFLGRIMNEKHVIGLSYLATDGHGHVRQTAGPLKTCLQQVVRYNYRKRSTVIRLSLAGCEKQIPLGIILPEDIRRQLRYGKVEAPIAMPERYQFQTGVYEMPSGGSQSGTDKRRPQTGIQEAPAERNAEFQPGDIVTVINGDLAGMTGTVSKMKKHTVKLSIHFLGQQLDIEVGTGEVQKL